MIYLDKFLHFISADGHHYKVASSTLPLTGVPQPTLMVGGRPFASYDQTQNLAVSRPLPLAHLSYGQNILQVYNLSNVGRIWLGYINISGNRGSVSVESAIYSSFGLTGTGMTTTDYPYFGYKVYLEFYDEHFQLKTTSDWIEWAYRGGNELTYQLRQVYVTLEGVARYVKIRYNCFQSSDVTDNGPHVDYASDYIRIRDTSQTIASTSQTVSGDNIYFIFSEQIS